MAMTSTSLHVTLAHAIAYLTRPLLVSSYPTTNVIKLQLMLEANLTALYAPTWVPREPFRGSGRRCLTLSPNCLPPRGIYSACLSAGVQWFDWIALLGGREFDFFVDPASVSIRYGNKATAPLLTVWSGSNDDNDNNDNDNNDGEHHEPAPMIAEPPLLLSSKKNRTVGGIKTFAQQVLEDDAENDDELFAMLAEEISVPTWMTPILDQFPVPARSFSPLSEISQSSSSSSSRASSPSSSFSSLASSSTEYAAEMLPNKLSRRERARRARVFVDTTRTTVTPYDGGKTTVLTGGVMLGGAPKPKKAAAAVWPARTYEWRFNTI